MARRYPLLRASPVQRHHLLCLRGILAVHNVPGAARGNPSGIPEPCQHDGHGIAEEDGFTIRACGVVVGGHDLDPRTNAMMQPRDFFERVGQAASSSARSGSSSL
jgi:hypothetical protein